MACPKKVHCPLYPLFTTEAVLAFWQLNYCDGNYSDCARFQSSQKGVRPSDEMLPNGKLLKINSVRVTEELN